MARDCARYAFVSSSKFTRSPEAPRNPLSGKRQILIVAGRNFDIAVTLGADGRTQSCVPCTQSGRIGAKRDRSRPAAEHREPDPPSVAILIVEQVAALGGMRGMSVYTTLRDPACLG